MNDPIFPVPDAGNPIDGCVFVQEYEVAVPVKLIALVRAPWQRSWLATGLTTGVGFTFMVNVTGVPIQVNAPDVNESVVDSAFDSIPVVSDPTPEPPPVVFRPGV